MTNEQNHELESLGLWGDGDEIAAIQAVEEEFSVTLDTTDAINWHTVGDVFEALLRALPPSRRNAPEVWPVFARTISMETGADWTRVGEDTHLLTTKGRSWRMFWPIVLVGFAAGCVLVLWRP